jgi:hypothetical protein
MSGEVELAGTAEEPNNEQIVVPANSTIEFQLSLNIGATQGIGDGQAMFELEGTPTIKRARIISGVTEEIEKLLLEDGTAYSLQPYLNTRGHSDFVTLKPGDFLPLADKLPNVKIVVWNKGASDALSPDEIEFIQDAESVNHFICGDRVIGSLVDNDGLDFFGLEWIGWNLEALGSTGAIWISGQENDVITGDLGGNIQGHLIRYYINMVSIIDSRNVFPIMHFQNDGNRQLNNFVFTVSAEDAIFGIRSTRNNTRTVLLGITPYIIADEDIRQSLIDNILDWLGVIR